MSLFKQSNVERLEVEVSDKRVFVQVATCIMEDDTVLTSSAFRHPIEADVSPGDALKQIDEALAANGFPPPSQTGKDKIVSAITLARF